MILGRKRLVLIAVAALLAASAPRAVLTDELTTGSLKMSDDIRSFCSNIADAAREQRYALQRKELEKLKEEISDKMRELEATRAAIEIWMKKREDFSEAARESVVEIYSKMRPDAAAGRMEQLDGSLAAAILLKLSPRQAGVILNEMSTDRAALLTGIMAAAAETDERS